MDALLEAIDWRNVALVLVVTMLVAIAGLVRGWWVVGRRYDEVLKERDYWRDRFFNAIDLGEKAANIAAREVGL